MEDFDEITSYLRPTRKNNMILGGLLAFAVVSFLVSGWLQSISAEYSNDIKDFDFDLPSKLCRITTLFRVLTSAFSVLGFMSRKIGMWTLCTTCAAIAFIMSLFTSLVMLFGFTDKLSIVLSILLILLDTCCITLFAFIIIAFVYQSLVYGKDSQFSLDLNDPKALMMKNLLNSMLRVIPGIGFYFAQSSTATKSA